MENARSKVAVFGDLTALYSARAKTHRSINYAELDESIKAYFGVTEFDENQFFTLMREDNEKQVSFISGLEKLGWNVEKTSHRETRRVVDSKNYRFDAAIAYELASSVDSFENIVIVSDSIDLYRPMKRFSDEDSDCKVHLAFFGDGLDTVWISPLREKSNTIEFIDLNKFTH